MKNNPQTQKPCQRLQVSAAAALMASLFIPLSSWLHPSPASSQSLKTTHDRAAQTAQLNTTVDVEIETQANTDPVTYLDQLSECIPTTEDYIVPFFMDDSISMKASIQGWDGDRCQVTTHAFEESNPERTVELSICLYSQDTLAILTDDVAYEEARTGEYSYDSSDARDAALSAAMASECDLNYEWYEELVGV